MLLDFPQNYLENNAECTVSHFLVVSLKPVLQCQQASPWCGVVTPRAIPVFTQLKPDLFLYYAILL